MLFKSILGLATLAGIAAAETIKVWVGQGGMTISPDEIRANVGDKVAFHFASSGHDVAQGPFGSPCTPSPSGFYSGSVPSDGVFTVDVTDTTPKWVYCSVGQHCASGMVAVINPPASGPNTIDAYRTAASEAGTGEAPDEMRGGQLGSGDESETGSGDSEYPSPTWSPSPSASATPDAAPALLTKDSFVVGAVLGSLAIWFGLH